MSYFDDYKNRLDEYGGSISGSRMAVTEVIINRSFADSPSFRVGTLNNNSLDLRVERGKDLKDENNSKTFLFRPNSVVDRGDLIDVDGDNWIVIDRNYTNNLLPKADVLLCNEHLNWDQDGSLISYPCATRQYRPLRSIKEDREDINLPSGYLFVLAPHNEDTRKVKLRQRFILGDQAYEVVGVDSTTYVYRDKGVVYFSVSIVPEKDRDDITNRVADNSGLNGSNTGGWKF